MLTDLEALYARSHWNSPLEHQKKFYDGREENGKDISKYICLRKFIQDLDRVS